MNRIGSASVVAALLLSAAAGAGAVWSAQRDRAAALAAEARTVAALQAQVSQLRRNQPDWAAVAARVQPAVVTVATDRELGSGWVVHSDAGGSDIVTNYHVVAAALRRGEHEFAILHFDRTTSALVSRIDSLDDLAVLHVAERLPALVTAARRPPVGSAVMDLGSPLGLAGTVSVGVVAAYRSIFGSDYLQFTAAISPGNSGGPVVDASGHVVGIATAKIVMDGSESLAFAIPVELACFLAEDCMQA